MLTTADLPRFNAERVKAIARDVQALTASKRDFLVDRRLLRALHADGALHLSMDVPSVGGPGAAAAGARATELFQVGRVALVQLADTLRVPVRYLDRLTESKHLALVEANLNGLLQAEPKRHLVRTVAGRVRAVLSDAYRCVDNLDLLTIALQEFQALGVEVWDLRHDEDGGHFRVQGVCGALSAAVRGDLPGQHKIHRLPDGVPDTVWPMVTLSNSETGDGRLLVQPGCLRAACANGMTQGTALGRTHVGKKNDTVGEVVYSDETKRLEDEVLIRKVREMIRATFSPERFQLMVAAMNEATQRAFEQPTLVVDAAVKALGLPTEHKEAILEALLFSRDVTQFGLAQAITAQASPGKREGKRDALLSQFEDAGGQLLAFDAPAFRALCAV